MAFVSTLFERFLTRFRTITSQQVSGLKQAHLSAIKMYIAYGKSNTSGLC